MESPTESGLRGIELKNDWKRRWWPHYKEAIRRIQSHGIRVNGCFVLGLDGHGPDVFDDVYDFVVESELFDVQITVQTPFPGTPLDERLRREERLLHDGQWQRCTLFDVNYRPTGMTADELRAGFRRLVERLYREDLTKWRRENFNRKFLRPSLSLRGGARMNVPKWISPRVLDRGRVRRRARHDISRGAAVGVHATKRAAAEPRGLRAVPGGAVDHLRIDLRGDRQRPESPIAGRSSTGSCSKWRIAAWPSTIGSRRTFPGFGSPLRGSTW